MFQNIKILYSYFNSERAFIEVKDLETKSKKKEDIYYWFEIINGNLYHMDFVSMGTLDNGTQKRTLSYDGEETTIYFTDEELWTHCSNCDVLERTEKVPDTVLIVIEKYLNKKRMLQKCNTTTTVEKKTKKANPKY